MREEISQTFQAKIFSLNKEEITYEVRKKYYEQKMAEELDALKTYKKDKKVKKRKFKNVDEKITECLDPRKTKIIIDFNDRESASIKSFTVKKKNEIKVTSRFMLGKLLMFAKLSLKSFIYTLVETFYFPSQLLLDIYKKYKIEKIEINHVLTDTDSTALQFIIISDSNSNTPEPKFRNIVFEIIVATKMYKRFDSSLEFWDTFEARGK